MYMYLSIYISLTNSYNDKKYFNIQYTKYIKIWFKRMNSKVNNVISDREEMFAGSNWSTCLGIVHFMTKQTDTISGAWPFHDKTDGYYVWGLTNSWQNRQILCLGLDHFMPKPTDTMSGDLSFHDKTHWCHVWSLTISWQNRLILCLGLDHFMPNPTDTISGDWSFHDKTHWCHVWSLTISWQKRLILTLSN